MSEDLTQYLHAFVISHYQEELQEEVLKLLPKLIEEGITTPLQFRDKFNEGGFDYPNFSDFVSKLDEFNGNERAVVIKLEVKDSKLIKQISKAIKKS